MTDSRHRTLPPELRQSFPPIWEGFDLRGMKLGESFMGCRKCGVQMESGYVCYSECPNCLGGLGIFRVTKDDLNADTNSSLDSKAV